MRHWLVVSLSTVHRWCSQMVRQDAFYSVHLKWLRGLRSLTIHDSVPFNTPYNGTFAPSSNFPRNSRRWISNIIFLAALALASVEMWFTCTLWYSYCTGRHINASDIFWSGRDDNKFIEFWCNFRQSKRRQAEKEHSRQSVIKRYPRQEFRCWLTAKTRKNDNSSLLSNYLLLHSDMANEEQLTCFEGQVPVSQSFHYRKCSLTFEIT